MHVKNSGWSTSNFQNLQNKRNRMSIQHIIVLSSGEETKLSYHRQPFDQFGADDKNIKHSLYQLFHIINDPSSMEELFNTFNLSDDDETFRGYTEMIELFTARTFITLLFSIQKIARLNLGVALLKFIHHVHKH